MNNHTSTQTLNLSHAIFSNHDCGHPNLLKCLWLCTKAHRTLFTFISSSFLYLNIIIIGEPLDNQLDTFLLNLLKSYWKMRETQSQIHSKTQGLLSFKPISFNGS